MNNGMNDGETKTMKKLIFLLALTVILVQGCQELSEKISEPFVQFAALPDVDIFYQQQQQLKPVGVLVVRNGDKSIMAVKENPALQNAAIAMVQYRNIQENQCPKVQAHAEKQRLLARCDFDDATKRHFIKMISLDRELWQSLTQRIQLN